MATLPCPLPHVDDALRPYIHDRQETLRIRKLLARHVQSQIRRALHQHAAESTPSITPLTLAASPPSLLPEDRPPSGLTGLRKTYWEAVQAHQLAKNRRDALHSELNELQRESQLRASTPTAVSADYQIPFPAAHPDGVNGHDVQNYTSLLHQRRRHAKLQILLDALDRIADTEPNPLQRDDLRQWVKDQLGDAPIPPPEIAGGNDAASAASTAAAASENQLKEHVLRLKKELLLAKQSLDAETDRGAAAPHGESPEGAASVEAQIVALRAARDELIAWIEAELAKMPEGDESMLSGAGATPQRQREHAERDGAAESDVPIQDQVEAMYARYVDARASLVAAVDAATTAAKELGPASTLPSASASQAASSAEGKTAEQKKIPPSAVLPFIPTLLQSANDERTLVEQTTYLRHRIAKAQEETRDTIQRLASESHMVAPDAGSGIAWARAAREAAKESDEAVIEQIRAGEANILGAKAILTELDARREKFAELKGEV